MLSWLIEASEWWERERLNDMIRYQHRSFRSVRIWPGCNLSNRMPKEIMQYQPFGGKIGEIGQAIAIGTLDITPYDGFDGCLGGLIELHVFPKTLANLVVKVDLTQTNVFREDDIAGDMKSEWITEAGKALIREDHMRMLEAW